MSLSKAPRIIKLNLPVAVSGTDCRGIDVALRDLDVAVNVGGGDGLATSWVWLDAKRRRACEGTRRTASSNCRGGESEDSGEDSGGVHDIDG